MANQKIENWLLGSVFGVNAVSVFGFATFGLHSELLGRWPWAAPVFGQAYPFFARVQIALAFLALAVALFRTCGTRWLPSLIAVSVKRLAVSSEPLVPL
mgnify:CR=1 FL=1